MTSAEEHAAAERRRVAAVRATGLVGVEPGDRLDRVARRAAKIAGTPLALISLIDEHDQWNPGVHGEGAPRHVPREASFCSTAIASMSPFVVPDATRDPAWADLPAVVADPHVRFYAGQPIDDDEGNVLGVVCVLDVVPREAGPELLHALSDLAVWARHELLGGAARSGGTRAEAARSAAALDADELRTPLTVLRVHAELLLDAGEDLGPEERASLQAIHRAVERLEHVSADLVTDLRETADGAEEALKRWLQLQPGSERVRPGTDD